MPIATNRVIAGIGGKLVRDGSLDDVVAVWMDRIVEEHWGRNPGDNEAAVYFAMLKHSVTGLLATHDRFTPDTDYRKEIGEVLRIRSEEHTSELQSLMRTSYAVFCLKQ